MSSSSRQTVSLTVILLTHLKWFCLLENWLEAKTYWNEGSYDCLHLHHPIWCRQVWCCKGIFNFPSIELVSSTSGFHPGVISQHWIETFCPIKGRYNSRRVALFQCQNICNMLINISLQECMHIVAHTVFRLLQRCISIQLQWGVFIFTSVGAARKKKNILRQPSAEVKSSLTLQPPHPTSLLWQPIKSSDESAGRHPLVQHAGSHCVNSLGPIFPCRTQLYRLLSQRRVCCERSLIV